MTPPRVKTSRRRAHHLLPLLRHLHHHLALRCVTYAARHRAYQNLRFVRFIYLLLCVPRDGLVDARGRGFGAFARSTYTAAFFIHCACCRTGAFAYLRTFRVCCRLPTILPHSACCDTTWPHGHRCAPRSAYRLTPPQLWVALLPSY